MAAQVRDAAQQQPQHGHDHGQRAVGVAGARLAEAPTPLLTASTPVIAVHPAAKARSSSQIENACVAAGSAGGGTTGVPSPVTSFHTPSSSTAPNPAMNR